MKVVKNIGKTDAKTFADYILKNYGPMSHLKLQKLLFYSQAYHIAYFEQPLFDEEFQAWVHGPVCKEVFDELKDSSLIYSDLEFDGKYDPDEIIEKTLVSDQSTLMNSVLKELTAWNDLELESASHSERPWIEARKGISAAQKSENIISKDSMRSYYQEELNGKRKAEYIN